MAEEKENPFNTKKGREWIRGMLKTGTARVTFVKKNGDTRIMECTLDDTIIPDEHKPKPLAEGQTPKKRSDDNLSVWDINANGWRSFLFANVLGISFTIGDDKSHLVEGYEEPPVSDW